MRTTIKKLILKSLLLSIVLLAAGSTYAAPLYFPHIATVWLWQTEIAIINTSDQTITGTLKGYSDAGQLVETKEVTLTAHSRKQINIADEFTKHTSIGYIIFDTSSGAVQGYTKFFISGTYRVAIPAVKEINTSDIYIPHIASTSEWWTGVSLVNTTGATKTLTMTFNNGQSFQITLNANEHKAFDIASLFNNQPQPDILSAVITNTGGVIGLYLFGGAGGNNQLEGLLLTDRTASTLYYPYMLSDNVWWTGIVAYNPSSLSSTITVTPYSAQGTALSPSTIDLAGKQKYIGEVSALGLPAQTAWFRIDATSPLIGFELFGADNGNQLAAYAPGSGTRSKTGVFPKIEKNGWTGIQFVNTEATAASVTLTAYNDSGTVVATQVLSVGGYAQVANLPEALFSQDISTATYIAYSSDRNIAGFQFNGSSDGTMLDGLPGIAGGGIDSFTTGAYWEFNWSYKDNSWAQGSSGSTNYDGGNFRVTLGNPKTIQGVTAYEVKVTGDSIDFDNYNYAPRWKWIAMDNNNIFGSTDGATLEMIFDANTGSWNGGGFFTTFPSDRTLTASTSTINNSYINTAAIAVSRSSSQSYCETIAGYTVCPNDNAYTLWEKEYYKDGIGPVGYYFYFSYAFSGGGYSSGGSHERHLGLTSSSLTASDGFVPHYPWTQKTTLPSQRTQFSVASVNNKIYIMGGKISSTATSSIDVYDPATNAWSSGGSLPRTMYRQRSQAVNGKIYVFHGNQGVGTSTQLWESNAFVTAWTIKASMPSVFGSYSNLGSAASNSYIFVPVPDPYYYRTRCHVYDIVGNRWLELTEMPKDYLENSIVSGSGNSFYIMGGWYSAIGELGYGIENWRVDPQPVGYPDIWTKKANMPAGRAYGTSATLNGNIYVIGGYGKFNDYGTHWTTDTLDLVHMYNPVTNTWTKKTSMPMKIQNLESVVCNGKIYVIAPGNGRIYEYDPSKE